MTEYLQWRVVLKKIICNSLNLSIAQKNNFKKTVFKKFVVNLTGLPLSDL